VTAFVERLLVEKGNLVEVEDRRLVVEEEGKQMVVVDMERWVEESMEDNQEGNLVVGKDMENVVRSQDNVKKNFDFD